MLYCSISFGTSFTSCPLNVSFVLDGDLSVLAPTAPLQAIVVGEITGALTIAPFDVPASRIKNVQLASGSIVVQFFITPSTNASAPTPEGLAQSLATQLTAQGFLIINAQSIGYVPVRGAVTIIIRSYVLRAR